MAAFLGQELRVHGFDRVHGAEVGHPPVRVVADDPAVRPRRRDVGEHPVVHAVAREVVHVGEDLAAGLDLLPEQAEHGAGHVGVTDDVVGSPDHLVLVVDGGAQEHVVGVGDPALQIGLRDDHLVAAERA